MLLKWVSWLLQQTESNVCYVIPKVHINAEVTGRTKCIKWEDRSWIKRMETVSLNRDNKGNKWAFSGLQSVRNVKVVCDMKCVMYLLCCSNWEVRSEIHLIHVGISQLVLMVYTWQQIITITLYLCAFSSSCSLRLPTNKPQVVIVVPLLPFKTCIIYKSFVLLNHIFNFV